MKIGLIIVQIIFNALSDLLDRIYLTFFSEGKQSHDYQASFTSADEVLHENYLGITVDGERSMKRRQNHALIISPTGGGKTSITIIPTCLRAEGSLIINDPAQEAFQFTSGYNASRNMDIRALNWADASKSDGFNPLDYVATSADAKKLASILVHTVLPNKNSDPFWSNASISLISLSIRILKKHDSKFANFANVRRILQVLSFAPERIDVIVIQTQDVEIINDYKSFTVLDPKVKLSILVTATTATDIFGESELAKVTAHTTIDIFSMRKRKTALYLHTSTSDLKYYSPIISIFFETVMKMIMSSLRKPDDHYIFLIIEEMSSIYLPGLEVAISNCRKGGGIVMGVLQSYRQLISLYGQDRAESIRSNCYLKMYFNGMDQHTADELSRQCGKYTYYDAEGRHKGVRELITSEEARRLNKDNALIICGNHQPMKVTLKPYYTNPMMKLKTEIPPVVLKGRLPEGQLEYIV